MTEKNINKAVATQAEVTAAADGGTALPSGQVVPTVQLDKDGKPVDLATPAAAQGGAPVELTEKQIADYKAEGKVVVAVDDTPQVETITLEKTVAEAIAKKAGIALAVECTAADVQAAIEADVKEAPKEEQVEELAK